MNSVVLRKPENQRDFEAFLRSTAPSFFDSSLSRPTRLAAFNRAFRTAIGVPSSVLSTPQDRLMYTVPYVNGGTARAYSPDLPKSLFPYWTFRLGGTLSKTEACAGTLAGEGPLPLITNTRVLADGEIIKELDLMHLRVLSHHIYRGIDTNLTNITLGTDAAEAFSARVSLDYRTLRSEKPDATFFAAHRHNQISLEVDWTAITTTTVPGLISGGVYSAVSTPTLPTLQVWGKEVMDPRKMAQRYWVQKYSQKIFSVSSQAQTAAAYQLPTGEVYRGILISQYTNSVRTPISTLITGTGNIVIRLNGSYRKYETTWTELINKNQADYGIALPTGYAFLDFMDPDNGGLFESAFRTGRNDQLEVLVDTASVANAFLQFTMVSFKPGRA